MSDPKEPDNNIIKAITRMSSKTNKGIGLVGFLSLAILTIGMLTTSNNLDTSDYIQNEVDEAFSCKLSSVEDLKQIDMSELKTILQIGTINYETDVFHSEYAKNAIPAITNPVHSTFDKISKCTHDTEDVVIVSMNDEIQIYPKRILSQHLVINDTITDIPILISYSNLSGSYQVFKRTYKEEPITFGVSGKIYKNNDLLFDSKTESLWSQLDGTAKIGALTDATLEHIPFSISTFGYAKDKYPDAKVLSYQTGFIMNYNIVDYGDFDEHDQILQQVINYDASLPVKERVLTFQINDKYHAIQKSAIEENTQKVIKQDGITFTIYNENNTFYILDSKSEPIQTWHSLWYSWYDLFPETILIGI